MVALFQRQEVENEVSFVLVSLLDGLEEAEEMAMNQQLTSYRIEEVYGWGATITLDVSPCQADEPDLKTDSSYSSTIPERDEEASGFTEPGAFSFSEGENP